MGQAYVMFDMTLIGLKRKGSFVNTENMILSFYYQKNVAGYNKPI